ncbi:hypothetical protein MTR67_050020 [Solanum verrucosum]|uniref:pectinesterase n=1 Tax=Solanum verrucosum TaxID=315347 RepID=A0AAF0V191_SOLVR|nr:hypothetical protein MTR67_050020 [Solanum verrucosum]
MRGNGKGRTSIVWSESSTDTTKSATFKVEAPNFVAFGISFKNCEIFVVADRRVDIRGSITAQSRYSDKENSGFVFVEGKVFGIGGVYLGRANGDYSRVIFAKTYFSKTIVPQGWTNWSSPGSTKNLYHGEYKCHGPGSAIESRAPWSKQLNDKEAMAFTSIEFIQGKQWLPAWI